jgi:hypothetical protein
MKRISFFDLFSRFMVLWFHTEEKRQPRKNSNRSSNVSNVSGRVLMAQYMFLNDKLQEGERKGKKEWSRFLSFLAFRFWTFSRAAPHFPDKIIYTMLACLWLDLTVLTNSILEWFSRIEIAAD